MNRCRKTFQIEIRCILFWCHVNAIFNEKPFSRILFVKNFRALNSPIYIREWESKCDNLINVFTIFHGYFSLFISIWNWFDFFTLCTAVAKKRRNFIGNTPIELNASGARWNKKTCSNWNASIGLTEIDQSNRSTNKKENRTKRQLNTYLNCAAIASTVADNVDDISSRWKHERKIHCHTFTR